MVGKDHNETSDKKPKSTTRRCALRTMATTGIGIVSTASIFQEADVGRAAPSTCDLGTSCSGSSYPIQVHEHDDQSNGDLVSAVSEFEAYGSDAIGNWKIPIEVSSNASRPFCDCGTSDEIKWSSITFSWDSTEGDLYSDDTDKYIGGSHETLPESDFDYEDYADTAVEYGAGKLIDLVPYGSELKAAGELLSSMYHDMFVEEDTTETWKTGFDWNNISYEINQVSYWNKVEAVLDPDESMTIQIHDETDSDKISGHALENSFDWTVYAPSDSPDSSTAINGSETSDWTYTSVSRSSVEANPQAYGLTQNQLERLPGDTVTFAQKISRK